MKKEIPFVARMIVIGDVVCEKKEGAEEPSFRNFKYDSNCEYCLNTTAWD